jgi:hypothetical protein
MICEFLQVSGVQSKEDEAGGSRNTRGGVDSVYECNILVRKKHRKDTFSDLGAGCRIMPL